MSAAARDPALVAPAPRRAVGPGCRPTFSVVVAAWNCAETVGRAVRSALEQSEPPHEVIVCDDGSTDGTAAALVPLGDRIRLVRGPHAGASMARNAAASGATGDFVAVLDADDVWHPRRLERLGDLAAARPDLDLLTTDAWFVVDGHRYARFYDVAGPFPTTDQATEILRRNFFFAHVAVRRSVWQTHRGYTPGLQPAQDWDFWLRMLFHGSMAGCVLEPLADYVIHGTSQSADRVASLMARVTVLDRARAEQQLTPEQQRVLASSRAAFLRRARTADAERALLDESPARRRACLRLLVTPGLSISGRVATTAAVVAPSLAAWRLRTQHTLTGHSRLDRHIPGAP